MYYSKIPPAIGPFPTGLSVNFEEIFNSFSCISEIPVTFFDNCGEIKWECHTENKICNFFDVYRTKNSICTNTLISSVKAASKRKEPYVFVCSAGFVKIAVSLILNGQVIGCFIAGPIAKEKINENIIANIFNIDMQNSFPETFSRLILFLRNMKVYTPTDITHLSTLFNSCVISSIVQSRDHIKTNSPFKEQAGLGEDFQNLKNQNITMLYPYKTEKELIKKVKNGDAKGALEIMQTLLNEVLLIEAGNLDLVKTRMLELYAVLSRAAIESDASLQKTLETNFDHINALNAVDSVQSLRLWTTELINHFSRNVFDSIYVGNSYVIRQAVQFIRANYMNKISLEKLSNKLYINQSYLSLQFKHEMGITFTDYLNTIRIKVSKDLLVTTNLSLLDISLYSGFEDQSYFTKVFKKIEGCTPKEYRKLIQIKNEQS